MRVTRLRHCPAIARQGHGNKASPRPSRENSPQGKARSPGATVRQNHDGVAGRHLQHRAEKGIEPRAELQQSSWTQGQGSVARAQVRLAGAIKAC